MRILIVTPAKRRSRTGNRVTAERWAKLLRELGHRVTIDDAYRRQACDLMIALHARRSAGSIARFHERHPDKPLILALTGTDLYKDIHSNGQAQRSLELADRLVVLQPEGKKELSPRLRGKVRTIVQSVEAPSRKPEPLKRAFEVCVVGHLRPVKDPFRAALAAKRLPADSRIRIVHLGAALSDDMRRRAEAETEANPRYEWLGERSHAQTMQRLARARLLVLSSKMEGGANVVCEALAVGTPVVSSRIAGSIGLLGRDYPGYFPPGDTRALADLLHKAETDEAFYRHLADWCRDRAPQVRPERERQAWNDLLDELDATG